MNFYKEVLDKFKKYNIEKSDCDFIFCEVLKCKRTELIFKLNTITKKQKKLIHKFVSKRIKHIPLSEIFKKSYFYGEQFFVNKNVLSPRIETELLVEKSIDIINLNKYKNVLDLCTGSGTIAVIIKKHTSTSVTASDISSKALKVAKNNSKHLNVKVNFIKSNLFEKINDRFDCIISNPPYIKTNDIIYLDKEVKKYDPILALDGKSDGLYYYREIASCIDKYLTKNGTLLLEIGYNQGKDVKKLFESKFNNVIIVKDFDNNDRIIICRVLKS